MVLHFGWCFVVAGVLSRAAPSAKDEWSLGGKYKLPPVVAGIQSSKRVPRTATSTVILHTVMRLFDDNTGTDPAAARQQN